MMSLLMDLIHGFLHPQQIQLQSYPLLISQVLQKFQQGILLEATTEQQLRNLVRTSI